MKQKLSLFLMGIMISVGSTFAQNSAVTNTHFALQEANEYLGNGDMDKAAEKFGVARDNIDQAVLNEKTGIKAKTWKYRGDVYKDMLKLPADKLPVPYMEAAKLSIESYNKTKELDVSKRGDYAGPADNGLGQLYALLFNYGNESIQNEKMKEAMAAYDLVLMINPADTNAAQNAGLAAERANETEKAMAYYGIMINEQGATDYYPYVRMAEYYSKAEDYDKALEVIQKGKSVNKNPEQLKDLEITEFNIYLKSGKLEEAIANAEKLTESEPNNASNFARLGQLYDQTGDGEKAFANYSKALEVDPNNVDANYNMGAYYFNKGKAQMDEVRDMDLKTYNSKGKAMEAEGVENFKKAKPYFEKVNELEPGDSAVEYSLQTIDNLLERMK